MSRKTPLADGAAFEVSGLAAFVRITHATPTSETLAPCAALEHLDWGRQAGRPPGPSAAGGLTPRGPGRWARQPTPTAGCPGS